jgi:hypothetical protein
MEAPKFPSIFRNVKKAPRRFSYKPRHYDSRKEELEERKRKIEAEVRSEKRAEAEGRDRAFRPDWSGQRYRKGASSANLRLVVILMVLLFITYMVVQWLGKLES